MTLTGPVSLRGVCRIVQFNWPLYAAAAAVAIAGAAVALRLPLAFEARALACGVAGATSFWIVASLLASWIVYDRSGLMTGEWIRRELGDSPPRTWIAISAGFDEITPALHALFACSDGRALDIYDPALMTEPSIARARRAASWRQAEPAHFARLPQPSASVDAVVLALSAHELRTHAARRTLFREVHRVLAPHGRVVVAEHLRGLANSLAFGPGVLHFHSRRAWGRCFREAGFAVHREAAITPFVRSFVLVPRHSTARPEKAGGSHAHRS